MCMICVRLFNAQQVGCVVDMKELLKHELSCVPSSLARTDGTMNTNAKSHLLDILSKGQDIHGDPPWDSNTESTAASCVLVDGSALIHSLGKPTGCSTFADYGSVFSKAIMLYFKKGASRVDVVFDRHIGKASIKAATKIKRGKKGRSIQNVISYGLVPFPQV